MTQTGKRPGQTYTRFTNRASNYLNSQSAPQTDYLDLNFATVLTNTGGTVSISTFREGRCLIPSCLTNALDRIQDVPGRMVGVPVPPIPTLSEWAMILMGGLLASGALVALHRRRMLGLKPTV